MAVIILLVVTGLSLALYATAEHFQQRRRLAAQMEYGRQISQLVAEPLNTQRHNELLLTLERQHVSVLPSKYGEFAYTMALSILAQHPDSPSARTLALEVGRRHFARIRPRGRLTLSDEYALQSDILIRCGADEAAVAR